MKGDYLPEDFFWYCKEILEGLYPRRLWFRLKARKILASLAPTLLDQLDT